MPKRFAEMKAAFDGSRLTDALRLKKYKGLEAALEELRQIALTV
jgi:hypothetical protein